MEEEREEKEGKLESDDISTTIGLSLLSQKHHHKMFEGRLVNESLLKKAINALNANDIHRDAISDSSEKFIELRFKSEGSEYYACEEEMYGSIDLRMAKFLEHDEDDDIIIFKAESSHSNSMSRIFENYRRMRTIISATDAVSSSFK